MVGVLRKKISLSNGVPPSVSGARRFWERAQDALSSWSFDALGSGAAKLRSSSQVVGVDGVRRAIASGTGFRFSQAASPGLVGAIFKESTAATIAAQRLGRAEEPFDVGSPLLLRLLCEQPVFDLWRRIALSLPGHSAADAASLLSESSASGSSEDSLARLLLTTMDFEAGGGPHRVVLVFELAFLLSHVRRLDREAAERSSRASLANREALGMGVRASTVVLDTVLERLTMTVGECWRLQAGQLIPLPGVSTSDLALSADTTEGGMEIARGELGVWKDRRAIRLKSSIENHFAKEIEDL